MHLSNDYTGSTEVYRVIQVQKIKYPIFITIIQSHSKEDMDKKSN
jgi:hypothetical protein